MQPTEQSFELVISGQFDGQPLIVEPHETTDNIPVYHCYIDGKNISQLRQEPAGKWVQIWGDLSAEIAQQIGEAIAKNIR